MLQIEICPTGNKYRRETGVMSYLHVRYSGHDEEGVGVSNSAYFDLPLTQPNKDWINRQVRGKT